MDSNIKLNEKNKERLIKKKAFIYSIIGAATAILIFCAVLIFNQNKSNEAGQDFQQSIQKLCDFATIEYKYSEIAEYNDVKKLKIFGHTINEPFTKKGFVVKFNAYAKAGCKLLKFKRTDDKSCSVYLSKGKITDNVTIPESIKFYDMHDTLLNKLKLQEDDEVIERAKQKFINQNYKDIINQAEDTAITKLRGFMKSLGFSNIKIYFK